MCCAKGELTLIVYERETDFVMIEQHHHAILSGELAGNWRNDLFMRNHRQDVVFAITEHDRAWIALDATPLWNDAKQVPYSFLDLPSRLKLPHYQYGIDAVEHQNKYAALLCSHHYASFFHKSVDVAERQYYHYELHRQNRLRQAFGDVSDDEITIHVEMLKFFDRLSLYICLNEPGVSKENEFPWYRDGFQGSERILGTSGSRVNAHWIDKNRIGLTVFPFTEPFLASVPAKLVSKRLIQQEGVAEAYQSTPQTIRTVEMGPL